MFFFNLHSNFPHGTSKDLLIFLDLCTKVSCMYFIIKHYESLQDIRLTFRLVIVVNSVKESLQCVILIDISLFIESVTPSSGTYVVRIPKKNGGLGMTIIGEIVTIVKAS